MKKNLTPAQKSAATKKANREKENQRHLRASNAAKKAWKTIRARQNQE